MEKYTEHEYEQMEKYINRTLTEAELILVEQRMLNDQAYAEEIKQMRILLANFRHMHYRELVQSIHNKLEKEGQLVHYETAAVPLWKRFGKQLSLAASIILFLGAGFLIWKSTSHQKIPEVAQTPTDEKFSSDPPKVSPPSPTPTPSRVSPLQLAQNFASQSPANIGNIPDELSAAVTAYQNDRTDEAIAALRSKPDSEIPAEDKPLFGSGQKGDAPNKTGTSTSDDYRNFYLGLSYLKNGEAQSGLTTLQKITEPKLRRTANWYQALALIQLNRTKDARVIIDKIRADGNHPYQIEAQQLWDSLNP